MAIVEIVKVSEKPQRSLQNVAGLIASRRKAVPADFNTVSVVAANCSKNMEIKMNMTLTATTSNPSPIFATRQQVTAALLRAAQRAKQVAEQTGTQLVVGKPGTNDGDAVPPVPDNCGPLANK